jgi:hypothetical protein
MKQKWWMAAMAVALLPATSLAQWQVTSDKTVSGLPWPESVGCDAKRKVLYIGSFGSKLAPAEKDRAGWISKVGLDGKVLEQKFLPAPGGEALSKPKGIWVRGDRLWVTDIDVVWVFDLKTRKGRKLALPGVGFANDPAVMGNTLYISDNRGDELLKVEPADFLNAKREPKVTRIFKGAGVNPNGLYPGGDGMLLMVGFQSAEQPRAIYALGVSSQVKKLSDPIGRLDGVYLAPDGTLLVTDWNSGSLFSWSEKGGMQKLATGFKGPADFCVMQGRKAMTVIVPDLVQSQVRFLQLAKK